MANTLTGLQPVLFTAANKVAREKIFLIPSVSTDAKMEQVALNDVVTVPIVRAVTSSTLAPSMTIPEGTDQTIDSVNMTLDNAEGVQIPWEGEQQWSFFNTGVMDETLVDQFVEAFRTLGNKVEANVAAQFIQASRAFGTSGTTPFASSVSDLADLAMILDDNGAPDDGRYCAVNSSGMRNLRSLTNLTNVNNAGTDQTLRRGVIEDLEGFNVGQSGQIQSQTKGTGTLYVVDLTAGYVKGDTSIVLGTGSGTVKIGDIVTFAGDDHKYVVKTGTAAPGAIVIQKPGLMETLADTTAMTIEGSFVANLAFTKNAIKLATRPPKSPMMNGKSTDAAIEKRLFTDNNTGITYLIAIYPGYHKMMIEIALVWGSQVVKPEFIAILQG